MTTLPGTKRRRGPNTYCPPDNAPLTRLYSTSAPRRGLDLSSCVECKRRKQKCDRKEPCSHCVERKVTHLCQPITEQVVRDPLLEVNARLSRMETVMDRIVSAFPHPKDLDSRPATGDIDCDLSHIGSVSPSGPSDGEAVTAASARYGWGADEGRPIALDQSRNHSQLDEMLRTLKQSGFTKTDVEQLLSKVPGRRIADELVGYYFRDIDWLHYKVHEPDFRRRYETLFGALNENPINPKVDADLLRWLPLFFMVLCIAVFESPPDVLASENKPAWLGRFYACSQASVDYVRSLQRISVDFLLGSILISSFMMLAGRSTAGTIPLTYAFHLGLHRDPTVLNISDKKELELRRRAWAQLYHLDRMVALMVGRPPIISDSHTDTQAPSNLDDEELETDFDPAGHFLLHPTKWTYVIVRHKLAEILGRIAQHTFSLSSGSYQTVLDLDRDLVVWRDALPLFLSINEPCDTWDAKYPYVQAQRFLLACEWHYARVTLHRPYLLRQESTMGIYNQSRVAASESAEADLLNRREYMMEKGRMTGGRYRMTDSLMVIAVVIKLEGDSARAVGLRNLLDVLARRYPDSQGRISEPLGVEELAVVEQLSNKTQKDSAGPGGAPPSIDHNQSTGWSPGEPRRAAPAFSEALTDTHRVTLQGSSGTSRPRTQVSTTVGLPTLADWAATFAEPSNTAAAPNGHITIPSTASQSEVLSYSPPTDFIANLFHPQGPSLPYGQASANTFDLGMDSFAAFGYDEYLTSIGSDSVTLPAQTAFDIQTPSFEALLASLVAQQPAA